MVAIAASISKRTLLGSVFPRDFDFRARFR
jgi:hypothetical protein